MNLSIAHQRQSSWEESKGKSGGGGVFWFLNIDCCYSCRFKAPLNDLKLRHGGFPLLGASAEVSPVWYAWAFFGGEKLETFFHNWGNDLHALFWTSLSERSPSRNRQMTNGWHCTCCDRRWCAAMCHDKAIFNQTGSTVSVLLRLLFRVAHIQMLFFHTAFCTACISLLLRRRLVDGDV